MPDKQALTALLVGATIIEVETNHLNELDSVLVATKSGLVYKLETYGSYGEDSWIEVEKVGKKQ